MRSKLASVKAPRSGLVASLGAFSILIVACSGSNSDKPAAASDKTTTTSRAAAKPSTPRVSGATGTIDVTGATTGSTTSTTRRGSSTTTTRAPGNSPADPAATTTTRAGVTTTTRASVTTTTVATTTTTTQVPVPGGPFVAVSKGPATTGCSRGTACAYLDVTITNFTPGQSVTVQCSSTAVPTVNPGSFSATIGPDGSYSTGLISLCKFGVTGQYVYATVGTVHSTHLKW